MKFRPLGRTGLQVSILGFGASSLGGVFRPIDENEGIRALHLAFDQGVNFVDVSPYYGKTKAETVLGRGLRGIARDRYLLATKVGRYGPNLADFAFSAARVQRSVDESLTRLGVEHIDLIQCHDIEFGDLDQIITETVPALRQLQQTGKVRHVGITALPLKALRYVAERVEVDTVLSYCHYELNDTALADELPYYAARGIGVLSAAPLGMGMLCSRPAPVWHPAPAELLQACAKAAALCSARGTTIEALALRFAVEPPGIASTIISTADPEEMQANLRAIAAPMDHALLAEVQAIFAPVFNVTWLQGRPENN